MICYEFLNLKQRIFFCWHNLERCWRGQKWCKDNENWWGWKMDQFLYLYFCSPPPIWHLAGMTYLIWTTVRYWSHFLFVAPKCSRHRGVHSRCGECEERATRGPARYYRRYTGLTLNSTRPLLTWLPSHMEKGKAMLFLWKPHTRTAGLETETHTLLARQSGALAIAPRPLLELSFKVSHCLLLIPVYYYIRQRRLCFLVVFASPQ